MCLLEEGEPGLHKRQRRGSTHGGRIVATRVTHGRHGANRHILTNQLGNQGGAGVEEGENCPSLAMFDSF